MSTGGPTPGTTGAAHDSGLDADVETGHDTAPATDDTVVTEGRTEAGLLRVFTRVAHGEHLHAPRAQSLLATTHFTRRRPATALDASTRRARGTTARKVTWS